MHRKRSSISLQCAASPASQPSKRTGASDRVSVAVGSMSSPPLTSRSHSGADRVCAVRCGHGHLFSTVSVVRTCDLRQVQQGRAACARSQRSTRRVHHGRRGNGHQSTYRVSRVVTFSDRLYLTSQQLYRYHLRVDGTWVQEREQ